MTTIRQQMVELLRQEPLNAMELSHLLSIREREVYDHLAHIVRSMAARQQKVSVEPYCCVQCGYVFRKRNRHDRPGRCPSCKGGHIRMATYRIEP